MKWYRIPLFVRKTNVKTDCNSFGGKVACLHVDQVGVFVAYDEEKQLEPDNIRRHLTFRHNFYGFVEAENPAQAIRNFYEEWKGAKIGGEAEEAKAVWINRNEKILELPSCKLLNKNKQGQFICGNDLGDGNGEDGMCILEQDYDAPDNCPVTPFLRLVYELKEENKLTVEIVLGFEVVRADQLPAITV